MTMKKQTRKTMNPRKGGSVVKDKNGKILSDSNDKKSDSKAEGKANAN